MQATIRTTRSLERVGAIGLSRKERTAIIKILHERRSHREAAAEDGITQESSRKRLWRARKRARLAGVDIPPTRRSYQTVTLAELAFRN